MTQLQSGQRIDVSGQGAAIVRFGGLDAGRVALAAISPEGNVSAFIEHSPGEWQLSSFEQPGDHYEIVAYITDDRHGGFVNSAYPTRVEIGGIQYDFPAPQQQLAAVILGEIYLKDGRRRLKVSNEGFTFGIDAYLRAKQLQSVVIPHRNRPAPLPGGGPGPDTQGRPPRGSGSPLASGSGVIIGRDLVVTNAHVIEDGSSFQLGRTRSALTPVAVDEAHDLALLQGSVSGTPLPIRLGSPLWLGEGIMASGYPLMDILGADLKVTTGNVSGLTGKSGDVSRFQFTAPIASGSSGGAIIDEFGNLVGITSASLAHESMRERGSISENVNFGIRSSLVFEMAAAAGMPLPSTTPINDGTRRDAVAHLRNSVVSIIVIA
ncbi:S1C family serine protease [Novosphingobium sp. TCA1]|uniref:S1C family serine protease n=1 Tax=Novosphingobium sp. TCA1 TaxID=2682474 RepID=UPI00130D1272|nr:serine protease [Novosphingobium sp. TCA1]GFE77327.1 hypothetical protein NTCA1_49760 [Novosphingobium sp. TCA1]